ncbi:pentatricopeptide repeat-containing protein At1g11290, chloroplastic [Cryptomeria japonica]|uniref:pentatricopeptide repeat-containing protein At1g11290, chloroplastic n=1 Tax=Cryptomeria japonica TaxID=3369 RepID=UPI0027DA04F9|nr:pentatricopeptide repeat-containing protein At1g11290, chloroplastic [Cryptomeria japonica]
MAVLKLNKLRCFKCLQKLSFHHHIHVYANTVSYTAQKPENCNLYTLKHKFCNVNFFPLLEACKDIETLRQVHAQIFATGFNQNLLLGTNLVDMYSKYASMEDARQVFDKMCERDSFLWNVMIRGYAMNGLCEMGLRLYCQMQETAIELNSRTYTFALKACAGLLALEKGKVIHNRVVKIGFEMDVFVGNSLVDMYAKCGCLEMARQVFDRMIERDVVSWNSMIVGYAQNGCADEALGMINRLQFHCVKPDSITLMGALQACALLGDERQGMIMHTHVIQRGFEFYISVRNSLIDMYAKCGYLAVARHLFDKMGNKDVVSWNAMIAGYAQNGCASEALLLFHQLQLAGITSSCSTMVSVLQACAHSAALQQGKWVHGYAMRRGFTEVVIVTAIIDMYAKSGSIASARKVFDKMRERNVVSWNAMIAGYGMHGYGKDAIALFCTMQETSVEPNDVTFLCVLSACSHAGMVDEGRQYFDHMIQDNCFTPRMEHYVCMVDLLGRAGHLEEAHELIVKIPFEADARVWGALLSACRLHSNISIGQLVAEKLLSLKPEDSGYYVLLSNIYATACMWDDAEKVRTLMRERGIRKAPGWSLIEVNNRVHAFLVGDRSHPQSEEIYATLEALTLQIKEAGYVPKTNFVLYNVEEDLKEHMLLCHSEKLAIVFGLINTPPGTTIRITKNLRVCGDCHDASKFISKIVSREIVVRDANRFHHFKNGLCSCGDYW